MKTNILVLGVALMAASLGHGSTLDPKSEAIASLVSIHNRIQKEGYENVLAKANWPAPQLVSADEQMATGPDGPSTNPFDDCIFTPNMAGCPQGGDGGLGNPFGTSIQVEQLKDDGIQILATEVLYQTLTFFKVKHVFGKIKGSTWAFKVIDPVDGEPFQDLDSDGVIGAIKQFRKYVIGLLCNEPSPGHVLAMMNKYDVGTRFRWDMAWALLGNELPDTPNKYMTFGAKWRKFSAAMDGIENGSMMRLMNPSGGYTPFDPAPIVQAQGAPTKARVGFVAQEVISVIRLAGDILASPTIDLFCVSDLSVNAQKEKQKEDIVYKLLDVKKKAYDHYGPLRPLLEDMQKKASAVAGQPINLFP